MPISCLVHAIIVKVYYWCYILLHLPFHFIFILSLKTIICLLRLLLFITLLIKGYSKSVFCEKYNAVKVHCPLNLTSSINFSFSAWCVQGATALRPSSPAHPSSRGDSSLTSWAWHHGRRGSPSTHSKRTTNCSGN